MSEALSSSEIEDVLSSIRRLVSDDLRPLPQRGTAPAEAEKLLLTPALRVVQSDPRPTEEPPALDEVLASVAAKVDAQGEEWESETGDLSVSMAEPMAKSDWSLPEDAPFAEAEPEDAVLAFVSHRHEVTAETVESPAFPEPQGLHAAVEEPSEAALPGWAQSSEQEEEEPHVEEPWAADTVEPDQAWADEAEAEVLQELEAAKPAVERAPELPVDAFDMNGEAEMPFNEEVLREIVRDVLREELQGRLGERITRNIRKLVRAEIARTMATDEFM